MPVYLEGYKLWGNMKPFQDLSHLQNAPSNKDTVQTPVRLLAIKVYKVRSPFTTFSLDSQGCLSGLKPEFREISVRFVQKADKIDQQHYHRGHHFHKKRRICLTALSLSSNANFSYAASSSKSPRTAM